MEAYEFTDLLDEHEELGALYYGFLCHGITSIDIYKLPVGGTDPQHPHNGDEVYYVIPGEAQISVGEEDRAVGAGSIVFVDKRVPHRFHSIVKS